MKKLIFLCFVLISNTCLSQELLWEINNTGSNHTLLLPLEENVTLDGVEIDESALVGVFYEIEGGGLQCGGFTTYSLDQFQFAAFGDDAVTEEKDGFSDSNPVKLLPGKMYVYKTGSFNPNTKYVFVIFQREESITNDDGDVINKYFFFTRNENNFENPIIIKELKLSSIFEYLSLNPIKQRYDKNIKLDSEYLLDSYNM